MGNFKNPENFFRVLIATLMPDKWGREMFIRWVAKIIDAIYG